MTKEAHVEETSSSECSLQVHEREHDREISELAAKHSEEMEKLRAELKEEQRQLLEELQHTHRAEHEQAQLQSQVKQESQWLIQFLADLISSIHRNQGAFSLIFVDITHALSLDVAVKGKWGFSWWVGEDIF